MQAFEWWTLIVWLLNIGSQPQEEEMTKSGKDPDD